MIDVRRNLNEIMGNIETSAAVFGRNVEDIELIAVTKYVDVSRIQAAVDAGYFKHRRKSCSGISQQAGLLRFAKFTKTFYWTTPNK